MATCGISLAKGEVNNNFEFGDEQSLQWRKLQCTNHQNNTHEKFVNWSTILTQEFVSKETLRMGFRAYFEASRNVTGQENLRNIDISQLLQCRHIAAILYGIFFQTIADKHIGRKKFYTHPQTTQPTLFANVPFFSRQKSVFWTFWKKFE